MLKAGLDGILVQRDGIIFVDEGFSIPPCRSHTISARIPIGFGEAEEAQRWVTSLQGGKD